ncbi:MAG: hypothetical protein EHM13_12265, partial [Acidobacteria bacterium]
MKAVTLVVATALLASLPLGAQAPPTQPAVRWFKGNTHAHTLKSDGDSTLHDLARWYREQRYHFLVVTDHNFVTPVEEVNHSLAAVGRFLVISGEEISDQAGDKP